MKRCSLILSALFALCLYAQDIEVVNIENPAVRAFMADSTYEQCNDYEVSVVNQYCDSVLYGDERDRPVGKVVTWATVGGMEARNVVVTVSHDKDFNRAINYIVEDPTVSSYTIRNMLPGYTYYYKVTQQLPEGLCELAKGAFRTEGQVRMIYIDTVRNVRDLGGWPTQFRRPIRYGRLFRGATMDAINEQGRREFYDNLNVTAELDLRGKQYEESMLGPDAAFEGVENNVYYYAMRDIWQPLVDDMRWIIQQMMEGRNIFFHCTAGADRTGTLAIVMEGLLGVSEADICRDYELTQLWGQYNRTRTNHYVEMMWNYAARFGDINNSAQCFYNYFIDRGLTCEELDFFRSAMLDDGIEDNAVNDIRLNGKDRKVYDLSGREVSAEVQRGIYIHKGRKYIVR